MKAIIVIPAYNEASRIEHTLRMYHTFFISSTLKQYVDCTFVVVPNGCIDATAIIVDQLANQLGNIINVPIAKAGKGRALKEGFLYALHHNVDVIGFVDADCATSPQAFYALFEQLHNSDAIIASRYMPASQIYPARPFIKRWRSKFIYEPLVRAALGINYADLQCGAKLFKKHVIKTIAPLLTIDHWAFDIELLYLCSLFNFSVKEIPTQWHDQAGSTLKIRAGFSMLHTIFKIKQTHKHLI